MSDNGQCFTRPPPLVPLLILMSSRAPLLPCTAHPTAGKAAFASPIVLLHTALDQNKYLPPFLPSASPAIYTPNTAASLPQLIPKHQASPAIRVASDSCYPPPYGFIPPFLRHISAHPTIVVVAAPSYSSVAHILPSMSAERILMNEFKTLSKEPWTNIEVCTL